MVHNFDYVFVDYTRTPGPRSQQLRRFCVWVVNDCAKTESAKSATTQTHSFRKYPRKIDQFREICFSLFTRYPDWFVDLKRLKISYPCSFKYDFLYTQWNILLYVNICIIPKIIHSILVTTWRNLSPGTNTLSVSPVIECRPFLRKVSLLYSTVQHIQ